MALLEDITKLGRGAGQGLLDVLGAITSPVAPILEQIPKIAAQYEAYQGNPVPLQLQQQEQTRNLLQQLAQQQTAAQPSGVSQLEMTPTLQTAIRAGDQAAYNKEVQRQSGLGNFELSVRSNPALKQEQKDVLLAARKSGVPIDELYKMQAGMMGKVEAQAERKATQAEAKQAQLEKEQRAVQRKQEEKAAGTLEARLKARLKADPTLATDPERLTSIMFLEGVRKPEDAELAIKSLRATGDLPKETTAWESVKNFFANLTKAPGAVQPPKSGVRQYDPTSKSLK